MAEKEKKAFIIGRIPTRVVENNVMSNEKKNSRTREKTGQMIGGKEICFGSGGGLSPLPMV